MSDSQGYEQMTIASDGVTVTKRFEEDEFPVPAIAFEFSSDRDESVTVRLSDKVPENVAVEDLGFHPEYGSEYWTIDEDTITFERELDANAEYTTVYGIRATGTDDVEQFLTEPVIEEVDPPLPEAVSPTNDGGDDIIPGSDDDVVRDVISGESDVPGLDDDESDDEEIETLNLTDPNAPDEDAAGEADGEASADVSTTDGSLITAMANEIRTNEVAVDDLKLLQRAFEELAERTGDGSTDARIQKLQADIADLRAYTDALEEFLDENGTGEQLIEDFQQQLDGFAADLDEMQSELQSNSTAVSEMNETVESVRTELDETVESVRTEMDNVSEDIDGVRSEVDSIGSDVEEVSDDVEDMQSSVDDLDARIDDLQDRIDELEDEVTDGDAMERVEDIEAEIQDLKEWQEQIKQTFGG